MICQSFQVWSENPVTTTVETRPITEIRFPKVTVCPPKNTFTDLNYDLVALENITLDNETRNKLKNYAVDLLNDYVFYSILANLSMIEDRDRYYNWYNGYTYINLPATKLSYDVQHYIQTHALYGTISTKHFGEKFEPDKVEKNIQYYLTVYPPKSIKDNINVTLHLEIQKISLIDLSTGQDKFFFMSDQIIADERHLNKTFNPPGTYKYMQLYRKVSWKDLKAMNLKQMPGLRLKWYYTGMEVQPVPYFINMNDTKTKSFIRNVSITLSMPG